MSKRSINIDILRIFASFLVVVIHVASKNWHGVDVNQMDWKAFNLYDSATRSGVPLFFMISGALFLNRDKVMPLSKLFKSNVLKLILVYIFWSFLYAIDTVGISALTADGGIKKVIIATIVSRNYLWFLPTMIGIYLLLPILHSFVKYENGKYVSYACIMFLIFGVVIPTVRLYPFNNSHVAIILNKIPYELSSYSGYFILGYYLSKKDFSKVRIPILLFLLTLVIGVATVVGEKYSVFLGTPSNILYGFMALPVFIEAVLIYIIFQNLKFNPTERTAKAIFYISKSTLAIYLVHIFILDHFKIWFKIEPISFNGWLSVPMISIAVFLISLLIGMVLCKIPVVNKYLV